MFSKKILHIIFLCLITFVLLEGSAFCGETQGDNVNFADYLFKMGEHDRAITEYYRCKYEINNDENNKDIQEIDYKIALSYAMLENYDKTAQILNDIYSRGAHLSEEALFDIALIYYATGRYSNSIDELKEYCRTFSDGKFKDDAEYMIAANQIKMQDFKEAKITLKALEHSNNKHSDSAKRLLSDLGEEDALVYKSEKVAGFLSTILPGAGQCYAGKQKDGIAAFLVNAIVTGGAIMSFVNDEEVLGYCLSGIEASFYLGNIYSAMAAANKHNKGTKEKFQDNLIRNTSVKVIKSKRDTLVGLKIKF